MAELNPPVAMQNRADHSALTVRTLADALTTVSAVSGAADLKVSQRGAGANMSVDVAGGICFIEGTESATQGAYCCRSDATPTNVVITAAHATLPRIDIIVAKVQDAFYSGAVNAWSIVVVTGTAAASPVAPSAPANSLILANVAVAAAASSIVNANITDKRAIGGGKLYTGDFPCTSTTRPAAPWTGLVIFETDTKNRYVWDGAAWLLLESAGRSPYAVSAGIVSVNTTTSINSITQAVTFPAGRFSVTPIITFSFSGAPSLFFSALNIGTTASSASGFTVDLISATGANFGSAVTVSINWHAIQMTPSAAAG